jgi:hypothetical protein
VVVNRYCPFPAATDNTYICELVEYYITTNLPPILNYILDVIITRAVADGKLISKLFVDVSDNRRKAERMVERETFRFCMQASNFKCKT